jgi:hypothetical protein
MVTVASGCGCPTPAELAVLVLVGVLGVPAFTGAAALGTRAAALVIDSTLVTLPPGIWDFLLSAAGFSVITVPCAAVAAVGPATRGSLGTAAALVAPAEPNIFDCLLTAAVLSVVAVGCPAPAELAPPWIRACTSLGADSVPCMLDFLLIASVGASSVPLILDFLLATSLGVASAATAPAPLDFLLIMAAVAAAGFSVFTVAGPAAPALVLVPLRPRASPELASPKSAAAAVLGAIGLLAGLSINITSSPPTALLEAEAEDPAADFRFAAARPAWIAAD